MLLPVRLIGVQLPWAMVGGSSLESWLAAQPWLQGGGIAGIRIAGERSAEIVSSELRSLIRRLDAGATDVSTEDLILQAHDHRSPAMAVCDALGSDEGAEQGRRARCANSLDYSPRVLLVDATALGDDELDRWMRELEEVRTDLAKRNPRARLVALVLHARGLDGTWFEMDVGGPIALLLEDGVDKPHRTWAAYLHTRVAWETAGNVDRAHKWEPSLGGGISVGRDDEVEARLNRLATAEWAQQSPTDREAVRRQLELRRRASAADEEALIVRRLFWRPHGSAMARPVPWLARALLLEGTFPEVFELLRSALVCGPLLRTAVGRCLDLEAFARVRFRRSLGSAVPENEAMSRFSEFRAERGPDARLYPKGCPARPNTGWAFAEFGSFVSALESLSPTQRSALHELRLLRNALAHGHYVPWGALEKLRQVEALIRAAD